MVKQYEEPTLECNFLQIQDVLTASTEPPSFEGDGWVQDPFTQN